MNIINIDPNFCPFGPGLEVNIFDFPSGCEPHIKISSHGFTDVWVTFRPKTMNDFMRLLLATDALKRMGVKEISLFISYLPFARQDRVMVKGEPLSVKVIADIINSQSYSNVEIFDPHSEVCLALINHSKEVPNHKFVESVLHDKSNYIIISPDAGAYKKIFKLCQFIGYKDEIVVCNKLRDVSNGSIQTIKIPIMDFQGMDVYIVDDICDGGGTFIGIAKELQKRNCGQINLIVSHGIFSQGFDVLKQHLNHIYTTNSFCSTNYKEDGFLTVLPL